MLSNPPEATGWPTLPSMRSPIAASRRIGLRLWVGAGRRRLSRLEDVPVRPSGHREGGIGEERCRSRRVRRACLLGARSRACPWERSSCTSVLAEHVDEKLHGRPADAGHEFYEGVRADATRLRQHGLGGYD